jgi:hypothetical protein
VTTHCHKGAHVTVISSLPSTSTKLQHQGTKVQGQFDLAAGYAFDFDAISILPRISAQGMDEESETWALFDLMRALQSRGEPDNLMTTATAFVVHFIGFVVVCFKFDSHPFSEKASRNWHSQFILPMVDAAGKNNIAQI